MKRNRGFSLPELLVVVAIIMVIATIAIPNLLRSRQVAHETVAVATLKNLDTAQISYTTISNGIFGTMSELIGATLIDSRFSSAVSGYSYTFDLNANHRDYTAYATAISGSEGRYDFYATPDWVIRYSTVTTRAPSGQTGAPVQ